MEKKKHLLAILLSWFILFPALWVSTSTLLGNGAFAKSNWSLIIGFAIWLIVLYKLYKSFSDSEYTSFEENPYLDTLDDLSFISVVINFKDDKRQLCGSIEVSEVPLPDEDIAIGPTDGTGDSVVYCSVDSVYIMCPTPDTGETHLISVSTESRNYQELVGYGWGKIGQKKGTVAGTGKVLHLTRVK